MHIHIHASTNTHNNVPNTRLHMHAPAARCAGPAHAQHARCRAHRSPSAAAAAAPRGPAARAGGPRARRLGAARGSAGGACPAGRRSTRGQRMAQAVGEVWLCMASVCASKAVLLLLCTRLAGGDACRRPVNHARLVHACCACQHVPTQDPGARAADSVVRGHMYRRRQGPLCCRCGCTCPWCCLVQGRCRSAAAAPASGTPP